MKGTIVAAIKNVTTHPAINKTSVPQTAPPVKAISLHIPVDVKNMPLIVPGNIEGVVRAMILPANKLAPSPTEPIITFIMPILARFSSAFIISPDIITPIPMAVITAKARAKLTNNSLDATPKTVVDKTGDNEARNAAPPKATTLHLVAIFATSIALFVTLIPINKLLKIMAAIYKVCGNER